MNYAVKQMNEARTAKGIVGGRFSTITPEIIAKARRYIDGAWQGPDIVIPTAEGLAGYINIARSTLYESKELSDTLEQIQRLQATMVLNGALDNRYNPAIAKLILSAKHGYVEKTEVANSHSIVAEPQQAIATDFSAYVKAKTQAVEGEIATPALPDSTTE